MTASKYKLDWVDALKGFAIIGILLNHFVESYFHSYPWFSNPEANWPEFAERMGNIFPKDGSFFIRIVQFLGWLGDMGPGIFIFVSGVTLTISALRKPLSTIDFYKKRLLRIYPLYIVIHVIILIIAREFFHWPINYFSPYTLLSILGLRFTNSLFFFINPSWWFIWFILQMYFIFPFLINLLKNKGIKFFLLATLIITVLSRLSGILGYTFSGNFYYWMTGLFWGTRLFEFALGMYLGYSIYNKNEKVSRFLNSQHKLFIFSIILYGIGFIFSWTYLGSIFSNILITLGLSGIFYSVYFIFFRKYKTLNKSILWVGKNAFSVFLLHQPFLIYFSSVLNGYSKLFVLLLSVIFSFILGSLIEKVVKFITEVFNKNFDKIQEVFTSFYGNLLVVVSIVLTSLASLFLAIGSFRNSKFIVLLFILQILYLFLYRLFKGIEFAKLFYRFIDISIFLSIVTVFLPRNWMPLFWIFILFSFILLYLLKKTNYILSLGISIFLLISGVLLSENYLKIKYPIEINKWGEFPALQIDNETVYSLIPNKTTHLKYNNYDYIVKTNSLGFNSPEISLDTKASNERRILIIGDAFSMPEAMEYQYSYPALLEKKLRTYYPELEINIINAGVTGYGPIEEYAQLNKYINTVNPDIVVNQLFINEFEEINYSEKYKRENIGFKKEKSLRIKYFGHKQLPAHVTSYLKNAFQNNDTYNYYKSLMYLYEKESPLYSDSAIVKMDDFLVNMENLCSKQKSEYLVLTVPGQVEVSDPKHIAYFPYHIDINDTTLFDLNLPLRNFNKLCIKNKIKLIDTKSFLQNYPVQPLYFEESWHWNKNGHGAIASYIADYVINNKLIIEPSNN